MLAIANINISVISVKASPGGLNFYVLYTAVFIRKSTLSVNRR